MEALMVKKLILVTSPPACGKTYISKQLAKRLKHVVYLDKDTLITLSKQIFVVANEEYNRSSDFFEENIRNYEYDCVVDLALEALEYDDIVLINAPFTREIRDTEYMAQLKKKLEDKDATLVVVWVETAKEIVHERMIARNSDRDTWKLEHWDEYIAECNFEIPNNLDDPKIKDDLIIFHNNNEEEFEQSMKQILHILEETMGEDLE
jgi:dephospho-CoA kinase